MKVLLAVLGSLLLLAGVGVGIVFAGGINFAADEPHSPLVYGLIETARERFVSSRSRHIEVPDLSAPELIASGAAHYGPMCAGCHLGPGTQDTEIRRGLYPQPPNLAQPAAHAGHDHSDAQAAAQRQFWIIKHGIKASAMPAWGTTHDDHAIWGLVAFVQKLPDMSPEEYAALQQGAADGHGEHAHGAHGHGESSAGNGHVDPPGAPPHEHRKADPANSNSSGHSSHDH